MYIGTRIVRNNAVFVLHRPPLDVRFRIRRNRARIASLTNRLIPFAEARASELVEVVLNRDVEPDRMDAAIL
jgi:hypothetical protein